MAFFGFLAVIVVMAFLVGEVHGLRQTMRERFTKADAELHTIESILDVHRGILDDLKSDMAAMLEEDQRTTRCLGKIWNSIGELNTAQKATLDGIVALTDHAKAEDAAHERLALLAAGMEELRKSAPAQDEALRQLKDKIGQMSRELSLAAESGVIAGERESVLSKAMEEGVMNLMNYAAGKAGTGIEVGLG